jgi:WD40 repeat protein
VAPWSTLSDSLHASGVTPFTHAILHSQSIRILSGHEGPIGNVEFSQDSQRLISTSLDTTLIIWDVATGLLQTTINKVLSAGFTPNKRHLVLHTEDGNLVAWDVMNTGEVASLNLGQPIQQAWFSEDVQNIFVTTSDGIIAWH